MTRTLAVNPIVHRICVRAADKHQNETARSAEHNLERQVVPFTVGQCTTTLD